MSCIKDERRDYFYIKIQELTIYKEDTFKEEDTHHEDAKKGRDCYFTEKTNNTFFGYSAYPLFANRGKALNISKHIAYYWDDKKNRAYRLEVRPCVIKERNTIKQVYLPQKVPNLYRVSYKFNKISQSDTIYLYNDIKRHSHAGFLMWDIQILDNQQTKYLNIDRDRLRKEDSNVPIFKNECLNRMKSINI